MLVPFLVLWAGYFFVEALKFIGPRVLRICQGVINCIFDLHDCALEWVKDRDESVPIVWLLVLCWYFAWWSQRSWWSSLFLGYVTLVLTNSWLWLGRPAYCHTRYTDPLVNWVEPPPWQNSNGVCRDWIPLCILVS